MLKSVLLLSDKIFYTFTLVYTMVYGHFDAIFSFRFYNRLQIESFARSCGSYNNSLNAVG